MLDQHAPGWSCKLVHPPRNYSDTIVQSTTEITIPVLIGGQVHMLTRSAVGITQLKGGQVDGGYGNPVSNCATSSFKKAARLWGICTSYQKPSIWMRMNGDQFPKYDPDQAGMPWNRNNPDRVPDEVRRLMREVRNPRNQAHNSQATGRAAMPENARDEEQQVAQFPTLAGLKDICGIKDVELQLVGNPNIEKLLRALVKARDRWNANGRRAFLVWAQQQQKDLSTPKKLEAALVLHEAQMLGGGA